MGGRREKASFSYGTRVKGMGHQLRELRKASGKTQKTLAAETGYSKSFISRVETNQAAPERGLIHAYEKATGVSPGTLVDVFPAEEQTDLQIRINTVYTLFDLSIEQQRIVNDMLVGQAGVFALFLKQAAQLK